jgi:hypothetical protein
MLTWEELKKAELGQTFDLGKLQSCCRAIYIGSSWPGKRPGFVVAIASGIDEICLLDELESWSLRTLVMQCGVFDLKYEPTRWVCDWENKAAGRFIDEMRVGWVSPTEPFELLEMKPLYPYILDEIQRLLAEDRRRLFLPDNSKIRSYLGEIEAGEIAELELGAYPAIEALAFAVIEMRQDERNVIVHDPNHSYYDDNIFKHGSRRNRA